MSFAPQVVCHTVATCYCCCSSLVLASLRPVHCSGLSPLSLISLLWLLLLGSLWKLQWQMFGFPFSVFLSLSLFLSFSLSLCPSLYTISPFAVALSWTPWSAMSLFMRWHSLLLWLLLLLLLLLLLSLDWIVSLSESCPAACSPHVCVCLCVCVLCCTHLKV